VNCDPPDLISQVARTIGGNHGCPAKILLSSCLQTQLLLLSAEYSLRNGSLKQPTPIKDAEHAHCASWKHFWQQRPLLINYNRRQSLSTYYYQYFVPTGIRKTASKYRQNIPVLKNSCQWLYPG
jgi:hypothetical protein